MLCILNAESWSCYHWLPVPDLFIITVVNYSVHLSNIIIIKSNVYLSIMVIKCSVYLSIIIIKCNVYLCIIVIKSSVYLCIIIIKCSVYLSIIVIKSSVYLCITPSEKSPARPMLFYSTNYWHQFWVQFVV